MKEKKEKMEEGGLALYQEEHRMTRRVYLLKFHSLPCTDCRSAGKTRTGIFKG